MTVAKEVRGHCNCGQVEFAVTNEVSDVYICHCSICRRATGSNGIAVVVVDNDRFRWVAGESQIASWSKPDGDWTMAFCRTCGSPLPGPNDPEQMYIPAGLINVGGENLAVAHHIWVESSAGWDEIGDAGRQHPREFEA